MGEIRLMKGNEALAEAVIRSGCDAYFGYPITPQSEVIEYLSREATPRTGMVVLQAESEVASINMVYGAAGAGKRAMTTSSSPGISLMQEGISYIACAELPCLLVNISRGGPGLGTIQPGQGDYFQTVKGGGHGDYKLIVLAPWTVQEMIDHTKLGWELAFKYRTPVMILADGAMGQMMEKVELFDQMPRENNDFDWATTGKKKDKERSIVTSLFIEPEVMEQVNINLQKKYREIEANELRVKTYFTDDAEYLFVAFGLSARVSLAVVEMLREKGVKAGLLRPETLYPFPFEEINKLAKNMKGIMTVELNAGQMVEDVRLATLGACPVEFYGRMGGMIFSPEEILEHFEKRFL